ncbi:MAG: hypothetical protein P4L95_13550 [Rouxiella aceris]|uniref:hypothetical protein n=1 Tax=Rouxiella aceris TaxID=2703884 RepID=UPI00284E13F8|nr:hypothetical protein [Rouxiella aceris]MDR3432907.1 hypothetical protein [Rouxiella aceris]
MQNHHLQKRSYKNPLKRALSESALDKSYKLAQTFALIVIPLIIAAAGWSAQRSISETGIRKDYVQMALKILQEPRTGGDDDIRKWAVEIIDVSAPIHFTSKAGDQLSAPAFRMLHSNKLLMPTLEKRDECPTVEIKNLSKTDQEQLNTLQSLCERNYRDIFLIQEWDNLFTKSTQKQ